MEYNDILSNCSTCDGDDTGETKEEEKVEGGEVEGGETVEGEAEGGEEVEGGEEE